MRFVYENREKANEVGERAGRDIQCTLSPASVGKKMRNRLSDLGLL
jgi:hypothetical protein